ncbi:TolC family protein [Sphingomonas parva]|uniref:TolC family protein n=1 Tax=Sphingomonas parva TaxID=2555898 RepID=A0A4Y8ZV44_9SPHN|nr:TolC family protein [Sphingomonas parva]TFI59784.1 TolC family protein [Sphingomonas parva]
MYRLFAAASVAAMLPFGASADAQVGTPATPRVGTPSTPPLAGPPAPSRAANLPLLAPREGPLAASLTLQQALEEAEARSPAILAARARVEAAEARIRQAGFRSNPELSVEVENFAGTGDLSGFRGTETTVALNQRLDLGGRRRTRVAAAQAELAAEQLRLSIARADLAQAVREQFARAVTARERLRIASDSEARARDLARVAGILVQEGREPPLRAIRARSAAAQALADLEAARAEERASRSTLASLFGVTEPPAEVVGALLDLQPRTLTPENSLEVRLAEAERLRAEAEVGRERSEARLDPAVGLGVRHVRENGDFALVGGVSMPLPVFNRNQGNIAAAQAGVRAAEANLASVTASARVRAQNAITNVDAAAARVAALENAAIPEAAEAVRLAEISYREGRATLLELLDAQSAYRAAQTSLIDARLAQALATAELGRVVAE